MLHQHADRKADRIGLLRTDPGADPRKEFLLMLFKDLRRHLVAGRPVIHIRQESIDIPDAGFKILHLGKNEGMELVLLKILMRKI